MATSDGYMWDKTAVGSDSIVALINRMQDRKSSRAIRFVRQASGQQVVYIDFGNRARAVGINLEQLMRNGNDT